MSQKPLLNQSFSNIQNFNFINGMHYSELLENQILGLALSDLDFITELLVNIPTDEVFYNEDNKEIFKTLKFYRDSIGLTYPTFHEVAYKIIKSKGTNICENGNTWYYTVTLKTLCCVGGSVEGYKRNCIILIQMYMERESLKMMLNPNLFKDPITFQIQLNETLKKSVPASIHNDWKLQSEILMELEERRCKISNGENVGVKTGFKELDLITEGIQVGLHVIAARPAMGKTAFALSLALNMAELKTNVGFVSLEMPNVQLASRLLAIKSGINFKSIFNNKEIGEVEKENYKIAIEQLMQLPIFVSDTAKVSPTDLRYKIEKLVKKENVKVVFIDYLQLVDIEDRSNKQRYELVGRLSRELKLLSKELNIAIFILAQLNRESEGSGKSNNAGKLSQLRESGNIEQDVDMGIIIDRPFKRNVSINEYTKEPYTINDAEILIQKHRNGEERDIKIKFEPTTMRFYDIEDKALLPINNSFDDHTKGIEGNYTKEPNIDLPF